MHFSESSVSRGVYIKLLLKFTLVMLSTRQARTAVKNNELASHSKKDGSFSSLSTRIQAWQASADSRQKHIQQIVNGNSSMERTFSTKIGSIRGARSPTRKFSKADSTDNSERDDDIHNSSCYNSGDDESVSEMVNELNEAATDTRKQFLTALVVTEATSKGLLGSSSISNSTELGEIQQSVQRLRAQRTHVECLTQRNDELELQLAEQKAENETLQREVFTLRGAEQENVAYLQSVKLLEQRARELEETCNAKKLELKTTTKKLNCAEQERDELCEKIHNIRQDYEDEVKVLRDKNKKLSQLIEQLKQSHGAQTEERTQMEHHWKQKMKAAARANSQTIDSLQQQLEISCKKSSKLETEVHELEKQVQKLLATTVRQTTIIEECDRMLAEIEERHQQTQCSYEEQLQFYCELNAKNQRLELQVAALKQSKSLETIELEKTVLLLENELGEQKDRAKAAKEALRSKDKEIEVIQRAYVARDDNRLHLDEVNKELQRKERKLKSEISELQIALRDTTDETRLLSEQVIDLQEKLESERKDRSHWATSRLKLLAEFCDEESKLSSALNHHNNLSLDDQRSSQKQKQRKGKNRRTTRSNASETPCYDRDECEMDERRRRSIVFG
ncbi:hypothetical protein JG687_00015256 [Phytophthora cactorum]|uniref:Uncharacterized protein n=1 Tax=Phytophthora cactorum TaxID=29920 RepID=A0A329RGT9_9STRA|nr:hypothetical protein Pcac1_g8834 [Phytophthora cactorum]KAG2802679.1 hypothetical protein PC111_g18999 [Phytophthora cactorum]KAG2818260.1 hypothetical protein PC112_g12701 [Phytophthora cactorum]KAG2832204.1 hypothetical protein PC113_g20794 [Phytophthora cactorum]KAG2878548.1 hypothetical protein PC114_g23054 [Phytophthora cactorum]